MYCFYWAQFLRKRAEQAGEPVEVTEMWDAWDLRSDMHARTFEHQELYSFMDVSQYALYFPDGGQVTLSTDAVAGSLRLRWLNVRKGQWKTVSGTGRIRLDVPGKGPWAAVLVSE